MPSQPSRRTFRRASAFSSQMEPALRQLAKSARVDAPLPATRQLGAKFGVANTTVFRVLQRLADEGALWKHPNGRYYPAASRTLLHRPKSVACLVRRLELCSELYRELLEGISAGCGAHQRTMMLWHDELLVNHPDIGSPPQFATTKVQETILTNFLSRHASLASGVVLDHVWHDEVIARHSSTLGPAVVLFRTCRLPEVGNIAADHTSGALMAVTHLLSRGYDQVMPVEPFMGDPAMDEFFAGLKSAVGELGSDKIAPVAKAGTAEQQRALVNRLRASRRRTALLVPEDNVALSLLQRAGDAGLAAPKDFGVLSAMGTDFALRAGMSCLRYDYREMGRLAVESLSHRRPLRQALRPKFHGGQTT